MNERQLLQRIAAQDEAALRELHAMYYKRLGRFLLRLTHDVQLVAELINDVFLVVWQKADSFRGDSSPSTWIMGIAHHKAMKALKAGSRRPHTEFLDTVAEREVDPLTVGASERTQQAHESISQLAPIHRAVLVLTYQFGYSYREIGKILNCPENTVKTRMHHARRKLKTLLEASS